MEEVQSPLIKIFALLLFIVLIPGSCDLGPCGPQCTKSLKWYDGRSIGMGFFRFHNVQMTFSDAEKYCASFGSHLIEFFTQEQKDFLQQKINTIHSTVWTNLNTGFVWWLNLGNFHLLTFHAR